MFYNCLYYRFHAHLSYRQAVGQDVRPDGAGVAAVEVGKGEGEEGGEEVTPVGYGQDQEQPGDKQTNCQLWPILNIYLKINLKSTIVNFEE